MATTRVNDLITIAARLSGVSEAEIRGDKRNRPIVRVRQAVMYVAAEQGVHSLPQIGRVLSRDHSTVIHAHKLVGSLIKNDIEYRLFVEAIHRASEEAQPFITLGTPEFLIPRKPRIGEALAA